MQLRSNRVKPFRVLAALTCACGGVAVMVAEAYQDYPTTPRLIVGVLLAGAIVAGLLALIGEVVWNDD